ncbi:MAG: ATP-binding protein, partial [Deltaproteobacteria bacterium]|nr:ATP-binding protein [Deltaproteobacteria bacterium]
VRSLDRVVVFIDEFEEIAASRDRASRIDKSITNELLKQVPLLKVDRRNILLICATNYIRQLDAALLRPGRFDCIIPVGPLDDESKRHIFQQYLRNTNYGEVDVEKIIRMIPFFTPADIEYLFQRVSQYTFEMEYSNGQDCKVTTQTFLEILPQIRPTLTEEIIREFDKDCSQYTRY